MPFNFVLPDLGEGTTEGEVRKWVVKEGDAVEEHQTVLEIETDKAVVEVPSPKKGKVLKINKEVGDIVKVGEILMTITEEGEEIQEKPKVEEKPKAQERPKSVSVVGVLPEEEEEVLATPAVRALARELGVKLDSVRGSGPGGSITKEDLIKASGAGKKAEDLFGPVERLPFRGLRRTVAKNMVLSQKATAFVTGMEEADVTDLWTLREKERKPLLEKGVHLTFLPFFIKAVYHALLEYPMLNASLDEEREEVIAKKYYAIGVAVDTPEGLMVPVIRDAVDKTIRELSLEIQELSLKARERKIKLEEMKGSTFTITNYGHFGGIFATPIINYPDVAILGTGRIAERPWVKEGKIVIRKILPLSLTFDHRVTDGVYASKFLMKVVKYLEDPALLFIESA
ncbi:MAG TPA: dihydrolipoamide acetyltransferase family protein [Thermodesulfovibrionales bacterium]|nr:dihydrolipoamide acetyltransferase family protein [Thermodesulfovibrionales bacterium]